MCRNATINEVCDYLNVPRELLFATFDSKTVDKIVELWDDGELIKVHCYGYDLDKNKTANMTVKKHDYAPMDWMNQGKFSEKWDEWEDHNEYVDVVKERQRRMRMINGNV